MLLLFHQSSATVHLFLKNLHCLPIELWAPQTTVHHLRILKGVQRRATRFILNCSYKVSKRPDYKSRLKMLKLLPSCYWHGFRGICFFYKCMHKYYNFNVNIFTGRTRNANNSNLRPNRARTYLVTQFSIALFLYGLAPTYIKDLLKNYHPPRDLRSSKKNLLVVPACNTNSQGRRAASLEQSSSAYLRCWNT